MNEILTYIWIELRPNFFKPHSHFMVEKTRILLLRLIIPAENTGDKQLQKYQGDHKHITDEEYQCASSAAASHHFVAIANVIFIGRVINALIEGRKTMRE